MAAALLARNSSLGTCASGALWRAQQASEGQLPAAVHSQAAAAAAAAAHCLPPGGAVLEHTLRVCCLSFCGDVHWSATATHTLFLCSNLCRWLQVDPTPPLPPLRLALLVSMLGLASVCAIDLSGRGSHWAGQKRTRRRGLPAAQQPSKQQQQQQQCEQHFEAADGSQKSLGDSSAAQAALEGGTAAAPALASADSFGSGEEGIAAAAAAALADRAAAADGSNGSRDKEAAQQPAAVTEAAAAPTAVAAAAPGQPVPSYYLAQQQAASFVRSGSSVGYLPGDPLPPRPELALMRGLSRRVRSLSAGRPRLVRLGFLSLITVSFASACLCQIVAPGFIDPSIVQLINMCVLALFDGGVSGAEKGSFQQSEPPASGLHFLVRLLPWRLQTCRPTHPYPPTLPPSRFAVLGVALVQSLLLHHHLPVVIWPSMLVMLGGGEKKFEALGVTAQVLLLAVRAALQLLLCLERGALWSIPLPELFLSFGPVLRLHSRNGHRALHQ